MQLRKVKFVFYDYETFGLIPALDKPIQFSCVITDYNLNIISSNICFFCKPPIDYLPNIESIFVTKISPLDLLKKDCLNEYFFTKNIHNIFVKKNICITGYNNFKFDDEFTRNIFYRNFFDPYSWHWKNNNSRLDILVMLRAYYSFRPENIIWPVIKKYNIVSFKLSKFTKSNNILHKKAHDAIDDVYATLYVAKFLKNKNKKLFNYIFKIRLKKNVINVIKRNFGKPMLYSSNIFGVTKFNLSTVFFLFFYPNNSNIAIMLDLSKDLKILFHYICKSYRTSLEIKTLIRLGVLFVYLNRLPVLAPFSVARKEDLCRMKIDVLNKKAKIKYIKSKFKIFSFIKTCMLFKKNIVKNSIDVDLKIYEKFTNYKDKKLMNIIHSIDIKKISKLKILFCDNRMNELFFRLKARNFICSLNMLEKKKWKRHCIKIFSKKFLVKYVEDLKYNLYKFWFDKDKVILIKKVFIYIKYILYKINNY
ncbi:exodeoxyribonuclease I [Buchnera aphidicola (Chaitoregma tattakana)]|uniref:exodeoxyribonuclease I n=1 Tax=Buchnera aphidicola TaxID=9 RepID=UPI0031B7F410